MPAPAAVLRDGGRRASFYQLNARLVGQLTAQDNADQAPTEAMLAAYAAACRDLRSAATRWSSLNTKDLPALNSVLGKSGLQTLTAAVGVKAPECAERSAR